MKRYNYSQGELSLTIPELSTALDCMPFTKGNSDSYDSTMIYYYAGSTHQKKRKACPVALYLVPRMLLSIIFALQHKLD